LTCVNLSFNSSNISTDFFKFCYRRLCLCSYAFEFFIRWVFFFWL